MLFRRKKKVENEFTQKKELFGPKCSLTPQFDSFDFKNDKRLMIKIKTERRIEKKIKIMKKNQINKQNKLHQKSNKKEK